MEVDVLAISVDPVDALAPFRDQERLPFPLVSDEDRVAAHAYGTLDGPYSLRVDYVLDPEGIVRFADDEVKLADHATALVARLRELMR